jgi:transcriptional regulator with XRE-family HTH domain
MSIHIGKAFRWVRLSKKLTQEDFSENSGRTYISELERGEKKPTVAKIDELSTSMGVHPLTVLTLAYVGKNPSASTDKLLKQVRNEVDLVLKAVPKAP